MQCDGREWTTSTRVVHCCFCDAPWRSLGLSALYDFSVSVAYIGRLAPSPTGLLHLGHAATFWTAYMRCQERGGVLRLRNEDLDPQRSRAEFVAAMLEDLLWLGIAWSGPVVTQSERLQKCRSALD